MFYISVGDYYMVMIRFTIVVCFDVYLPYHIFAQPRTAWRLAVPWVHGPVESIYPPSPSCKLHWFRGMFARNPYCIYYIYHECDEKRERDFHIFTSSTAQGGGGSFKNRKPIGELGCCESGMAERSHWWIERCLTSLTLSSLSLTIYLPTDLPTNLSISLCIYLSLHVSIYVSIDVSIYLSISPCIDLCIYRSIDLSIYLSVCLSVSVCLSIGLSVFLSVYLSSHLSIYLIYPAGLSLSLFHLITYLSIYLPVYLSLPFICLSVYLSICVAVSFSVM